MSSSLPTRTWPPASASWYGHQHWLAEQHDLSVSGEPGAVVVPGRQGLVAAPPGQPAPAGAGRRRMGEQPGGLGDGERDHSRVGGRGLIWPDRGGCPGVGAAAEQGGGDRADGQGGHDQHGVPGDRVIEADPAFPSPVTPDGTGSLGFSLSFAPSRAGPGNARQGEDRPGHCLDYVPGISQPPSTYSLTTCDLTSQELGDLCPAAPQPSGRPMPGFVMPLSCEAALFHGCRLRDMAETLRCRETCRRPSEAASPARRWRRHSWW
jgi:hypothetical protein